MTTNIQARIDALKARAAPGSGASEPERQTCIAILDRLRVKHPTLDFSEPQEDGEIQFWYRNDYDSTFIISVAYYLGCTPYRGYRKNASKRKLFIIKGPKSLLEIIPQCVDYHRNVLDELMMGTAIGYVVGALPSKEKDDDNNGSKAKPPKMSAERLAAARAAYEVGKKHQGRHNIEALPAHKEE